MHLSGVTLSLRCDIQISLTPSGEKATRLMLSSRETCSYFWGGGEHVPSATFVDLELMVVEGVRTGM